MFNRKKKLEEHPLWLDVALGTALCPQLPSLPGWGVLEWPRCAARLPATHGCGLTAAGHRRLSTPFRRGDSEGSARRGQELCPHPPSGPQVPSAPGEAMAAMEGRKLSSPVAQNPPQRKNPFPGVLSQGGSHHHPLKSQVQLNSCGSWSGCPYLQSLSRVLRARGPRPVP